MTAPAARVRSAMDDPTPRMVDARFTDGPWRGQVRVIPRVDTLLMPGELRREGRYVHCIAAVAPRGGTYVEVGHVYEWIAGVE